ncbi:single-stranded DNA-binding protein [Subtercola vilae]|uniref:single-stranded DNA-binding protein n=1 Tax=Subtercola vilae TaxID=2056433 RepID=UPI0013758671|nr:single-stranded DNA-binding protein [Subtercola vilae]
MKEQKPLSTARTITGNLAADVEVVKAGSIDIAKLRVIESTGEYRGGKYVEHPDATTPFVEAKFELGENVAATLHKGDAVIVIGREHTSSWGPEGSKTYGRVIDADTIGVDLGRAVAAVRKVTRDDDGR